MSISKCICVEGRSTISFDDAIKYALFEVSKSVDYIYDIKIDSMCCKVTDNKIAEYVVHATFAFYVDMERVEKWNQSKQEKIIKH